MRPDPGSASAKPVDASSAERLPLIIAGRSGVAEGPHPRVKSDQSRLLAPPRSSSVGFVPNEFIVKVASRCNLNCTYCYMYNKGDSSWLTRPAIMPDELFGTTIERIREHCSYYDLSAVSIAFHGGEPTLIGISRFNRWCELARRRLGGVQVKLAIQTNATLLNSSWARALAENKVLVGVSVDGPATVNDAHRVDRHGKGSHRQIIQGLDSLRAEGVSFGILTVIPLGATDPVSIHKHLNDLGPTSIGYLFPDETHETIGGVRCKFGPAPVSDFLIPIFDEWLYGDKMRTLVHPFWEMALAIRGGNGGSESLQNGPFQYLVIETDGEIQGSDVLRICDGGGTSGKNVSSAMLRDVLDSSPLATALQGGIPLATVCQKCAESDTCGGGFLPHRYSRERGFDNPSVWCADLLRLFTHIRARMRVSPSETALRRRMRPGANGASSDIGEL